MLEDFFRFQPVRGDVSLRERDSELAAQLEAADFRGRGVNSPLLFMMYVLARKNKARDLETGDVN